MKENFNRELIDLRKFDNPINPIDLIKKLTSNPNIENDPFYIVDLEDICNKHINWITRLPRVEPHYAIKCNTDSMLLKLLAFLGAGFDCASKNEIQQVLDLGVSPHRIIFANPCKQASYIKYANKVGVDYMTFDNENELYKIKEHHPNAKCVLRIITNDQNAVCRFSMKFGADMATSVKLIEVANNLNLDLVGISFHVGSGQMSPQAFSESIENARQLFDYAREQFGIKMHLLDLGGGYPGSSDSNDLFNAIAKEINRALDQHFPVELFDKLNASSDDEKKFKVIAEPGRYYACSAFTLCTNVIAKRVMQQSDMQQEQDKETIHNMATSNHQTPPISIHQGANGCTQVNMAENTDLIDKSKSIMYYINDGVYASFNCLFYDHAECFPILINDNLNMSSVYKSSIWGPTCDGLDVVVKECYLPDIEMSDYLVFKNMGAYTLSGAVAFNGIPLAKCIYVASTSWDTIKDAFTESAQDEAAYMMLTNSSASCSALAFQRALSINQSSNQQQQISILSEGLSDEHHSLGCVQMEDVDALNNEESCVSAASQATANCLENSVDCAITC